MRPCAIGGAGLTERYCGVSPWPTEQDQIVEGYERSGQAGGDVEALGAGVRHGKIEGHLHEQVNLGRRLLPRPYGLLRKSSWLSIFLRTISPLEGPYSQVIRYLSVTYASNIFPP